MPSCPTALLLSAFTICCVSALTTAPVVAATQDRTPFAVSNRNPLVAVFGLPEAQSAEIRPEEHWRTTVSYEIVNTSTDSSTASSPTEAIELDGEIQRASLKLDYGFAERWDASLTLRRIRHSGGHSDGFIEDWHSFFGLPNGNRDDREQNLLNYQYSRDGQSLIDFTEDEQDLGDVSLSIGYQIHRAASSGSSVRLHVKADTGELESLTGSDGTDVGVSLHGFHDWANWRLEGSLGGVQFGNSDLLDEIREDSAAFGSATLYWQANGWAQFKLQFDWHTALFDSALEELGDDTMMLTLGGVINLNTTMQLELFVVEDIAVNTAPDVVFGIALKAITGP